MMLEPFRNDVMFEKMTILTIFCLNFLFNLLFRHESLFSYSWLLFFECQEESTFTYLAANRNTDAQRNHLVGNGGSVSSDNVKTFTLAVLEALLLLRVVTETVSRLLQIVSWPRNGVGNINSGPRRRCHHEI
jgi:hypothetical protein